MRKIETGNASISWEGAGSYELANIVSHRIPIQIRPSELSDMAKAKTAMT